MCLLSSIGPSGDFNSFDVEIRTLPTIDGVEPGGTVKSGNDSDLPPGAVAVTISNGDCVSRYFRSNRLFCIFIAMLMVNVIIAFFSCCDSGPASHVISSHRAFLFPRQRIKLEFLFLP